MLATRIFRGALAPSIATGNGQHRCLHCSRGLLAGNQWRRDKGLSENQYTYGPMTDLPDFSFADGRPTPMSDVRYVRYKKRAALHHTITMMMNAVMECKYKYKLGKHPTSIEASYSPMKVEARIERMKMLPTLSATADDVPQPANVDKQSGLPHHYSLQEGAHAAKSVKKNYVSRLRVMTEDQIKKELDS